MAFAAPAVIGSNTADGSSTTLGVTLTAGANIGDLVVVGVRSQTGTVTTISDPHGNTWQVDKERVQASSVHAALCSSRLTSALLTSDLITVTFDVAATARRAKLWQCVGVVAGGTYADNNNSNGNNGATALSSGAVTPGTDNCLLMACFAFNTATWNGGEAAGWTDLTTLGGDRSRAQYKIVSGAPTETATGVLSTAVTYAGVIQAYASAVVIGTPFRNIHQKNQAVGRSSRW